MRRIDQLRLARSRARKLGPIPTGDPNGIYLGNTDFISFAEIELTCQAVMDPANATIVEQQLGKMHYSSDPTYNLRRK